MEHLHGWFVAAAYVIGLGILVADAVLPRIKFKSLLRGILLRERRAAAHPPVPTDRSNP
jgi:heme exporter protein D